MKPIKKIQLEFLKKLLSDWQAAELDNDQSKVDAAMLSQSIKHMRALIRSLERAFKLRGGK